MADIEINYVLHGNEHTSQSIKVVKSFRKIKDKNLKNLNGKLLVNIFMQIAI